MGKNAGERELDTVSQSSKEGPRGSDALHANLDTRRSEPQKDLSAESQKASPETAYRDSAAQRKQQSFEVSTARFLPELKLKEDKVAKTNDPYTSDGILMRAAQSRSGDRLWSSMTKAEKNNNGYGQFACADSVSVVTREAGEGKIKGHTVGELVKSAERQGYVRHPLSEMKGGDLVVGYDPSNKNWKNGGGHAHVGIADKDGGVWNNSKRADVKYSWVKEPIAEAFADYSSRYVLRKPDKTK